MAVAISSACSSPAAPTVSASSISIATTSLQRSLGWLVMVGYGCCFFFGGGVADSSPFFPSKKKKTDGSESLAGKHQLMVGKYPIIYRVD